MKEARYILTTWFFPEWVREQAFQTHELNSVAGGSPPSESHWAQSPFLLSGADTANADPRAAFPALLESMGGSKPPEFVCWAGTEFKHC